MPSRAEVREVSQKAKAAVDKPAAGWKANDNGRPNIHPAKPGVVAKRPGTGARPEVDERRPNIHPAKPGVVARRPGTGVDDSRPLIHPRKPQ